MVAPFSKFCSKIWVGFCLNIERRFFLEVSFKGQQKEQRFFKNGTRDFQNSLPTETLACFYVTIDGNFERFQYFNFETNFLKNENLFQKTGVVF